MLAGVTSCLQRVCVAAAGVTVVSVRVWRAADISRLHQLNKITISKIDRWCRQTHIGFIVVLCV